MTDGVTLNPGVGGAKIATDALATINGAPVPEPVHVQRTKVGFGPDSDFRDVDGDHPLPVEVSFPDLQSVTVSNFPETQAISAASLPLPTGAATAAAQATGNTALAAISGQLPATLGQKAMAGSLPVTLASDQSALPVTVGNFPATQAVSAAALPLPSGAATAAMQGTGNTSLANLDADVGNVADAAANADGSGNYSLIAAAKRALLNWANLLARIPAALGQTAMAGSWPVAIASDQGPLNVRTDNVADGQLITGNVTSATTVVSANMAGYSGGVFHVTSVGVGNTITFEQSNDNITWEALQTSQVSSGTAGFSGTTVGVNGRQFQSGMAFVRARVSTYGSGTVTVVLSLKRQSSPVIGLSLNASTASIGNLTRVSPFTDSSTALAANATFTGTGRNTSGANYAFFVANVFADQAGTLFIDLSLDSGTTYRTIKTQAVTSGTAAELEAKVTGAAGTATLYRVRYTNGASAQGAFQLSSAFRA